MTILHDPDRIITDWLDEGPVVLPDATRRAILTGLPTVHRLHGAVGPASIGRMPAVFRLATGVLLVAVGFTAGLLFARGPETARVPVGTTAPATAAPSPSALPVAQQDPSRWPRFTSGRYFYSIGVPEGWTTRNASRDWMMKPDSDDWQASSADGFTAADGMLYTSAWIAPFDTLRTFDAWLRAYWPAGDSCTPTPADTDAVTADGRPGVLATFCTNTQAFIDLGDRVFVVAVWRPGRDVLVEHLLSTVQLPEP